MFSQTYHTRLSRCCKNPGKQARPRRTPLLTPLFALTALTALAVPATPSFAQIDLTPNGYLGSAAYGINDAGVVAGDVVDNRGNIAATLFRFAPSATQPAQPAHQQFVTPNVYTLAGYAPPTPLGPYQYTPGIAYAVGQQDTNGSFSVAGRLDGRTGAVPGDVLFAYAKRAFVSTGPFTSSSTRPVMPFVPPFYGGVLPNTTTPYACVPYALNSETTATVVGGAYKQSVLSGRGQRAFWRESDQVSHLLPSLTASDAVVGLDTANEVARGVSDIQDVDGNPATTQDKTILIVGASALADPSGAAPVRSVPVVWQRIAGTGAYGATPFRLPLSAPYTDGTANGIHLVHAAYASNVARDFFVVVGEQHYLDVASLNPVLKQRAVYWTHIANSANPGPLFFGSGWSGPYLLPASTSNPVSFANAVNRDGVMVGAIQSRNALGVTRSYPTKWVPSLSASGVLQYLPGDLVTVSVPLGFGNATGPLINAEATSVNTAGDIVGRGSYYIAGVLATEHGFYTQH